MPDVTDTFRDIDRAVHGSAGPDVEVLREVEGRGRAWLEQGRVEEAARVYARLMRELQDHAFDLRKDGIVERCVRGACQAFVRLESVGRRADVLHDLWRFWWDNLQEGSWSDASPIERVFFEQLSAPEREALADWMEQELERHSRRASSRVWRTFDATKLRELMRLLLRVLGDLIDEAEAGRLASQVPADGILIPWYLEVGRNEAAIDEARMLWPREQLKWLDRFADAGFEAAAEGLARRMREEGSATVVERATAWLYDFLDERGRHEDALELRLEQFAEFPDAERLYDIQRHAEACERWAEFDVELPNALMEADPAEMLRFYLLDEDAEAAVAIWKALEFPGGDLAEAFAEVVGPTHPVPAVEALQEAAGRLVEERGRDNYRIACRYLVRAREIYEAMGRPDRWRGLRGRLLREHSNLPAFKDEFRKAGLAVEGE